MATDWSGHRYCGRSDPSLGSRGRDEATRLAATLAPTLAADVRIVSSPLRRATETADAIARAAGIPSMTVDPRWAEADFGIAEGLTFDELAGLDPALAERLARGEAEIDWPGGEAAFTLAARVSAAWDDVMEEAKRTVVVSHAGPLRIAIALATGRAPASVELLAPGSVFSLPEHPVRP